MKKALLTGSTGGLGGEIAQLLAEQGWDLILLNRDKNQTELQLQDLRASFPAQTFNSFIVDLMDMVDIRRVSGDVATAHPQLDAIYNVAGLLTDKRIVSPQGIEGHFALNTIAPYLLTQTLRPQLSAGATPENPTFVANFSSSAVNSVKSLDVSKLVNPDRIGGLMDAYAKTKAALNVMACFLKDDLAVDNIAIFSVDPGATKTKMTTSSEGMPWFIKPLVPFLFGDPQKQARKLVNGVQLALEKEKSGAFIANGKIKANPPIAHDEGTQNDLRELMDSLIS
ncbi:MAG: SDR family NAD(P)-dependent oxidoreductase [Pseudomonadota bacterium]